MVQTMMILSMDRNTSSVWMQLKKRASRRWNWGSCAEWIAAVTMCKRRWRGHRRSEGRRGSHCVKLPRATRRRQYSGVDAFLFGHERSSVERLPVDHEPHPPLSCVLPYRRVLPSLLLQRAAPARTRRRTPSDPPADLSFDGCAARLGRRTGHVHSGLIHRQSPPQT